MFDPYLQVFLRRPHESFVQLFVKLFYIPVAAIGAFLVLNLSLNNLSMFALLSLIIPMGLVVKNTILIIDFINKLKDQHYKEALIISVQGRLRLILITTIAMIIVMLPIVLSKGAVREWKNGLAWIIIGSLFFLC